MRNYSYFAMLRVKTVNHRLESLLYMGSKLKEVDSINEFKHVIKTCKPDLCSCRLCKVYLQNIGYLQSAKKTRYVYTNIYVSKKSEYYNRSSPFALRCIFTFTCLVIYRNLWNLFGI